LTIQEVTFNEINSLRVGGLQVKIGGRSRQKTKNRNLKYEIASARRVPTCIHLRGDALTIIALKKWKNALRQFGLHCSKRGVDIQKDGDFDPRYIAKELAAHDTKTDSKSDLVTLFKLLDKSARGDKQAGQDWIRVAKAIQGRDRWNVGQLASKLGIASPSDWKKPEIVATTDAAPVQVIEHRYADALRVFETDLFDGFPSNPLFPPVLASHEGFAGAGLKP
jgi:hypothetical protein